MKKSLLSLFALAFTSLSAFGSTAIKNVVYDQKVAMQTPDVKAKILGLTEVRIHSPPNENEEIVILPAQVRFSGPEIIDKNHLVRV